MPLFLVIQRPKKSRTYCRSIVAVYEAKSKREAVRAALSDPDSIFVPAKGSAMLNPVATKLIERKFYVC